MGMRSGVFGALTLFAATFDMTLTQDFVPM